MSSTNRGAVRSPNDHYVTDPTEIVRFIHRWRETDPAAEAFWSQPRKILDPAAGGLTEQVMLPPDQKKIDKYLAGRTVKIRQDQILEDKEASAWLIKNSLVFKPSDMSYPLAIALACKHAEDHTVDTIDIRQNSRAAVKGDFLGLSDMTLHDQFYDAVITNPPFSLAIEFIKKSLRIVKPGGYVVMLLRLNFFGSEERNQFFRAGNMPTFSYVHAKRLGFTPDNKCDSIEYQHCVWLNDDRLNHETKLRVLPY